MTDACPRHYIIYADSQAKLKKLNFPFRQCGAVSVFGSTGKHFHQVDDIAADTMPRISLRQYYSRGDLTWTELLINQDITYRLGWILKERPYCVLCNKPGLIHRKPLSIAQRYYPSG